MTVEGIKNERHTEKDRKMFAGKPGPHDSRGGNQKESSYYVDPNSHVKPEAGPQEPVDAGKAGDKMIGKTTGGQDHFGGGSM